MLRRLGAIACLAAVIAGCGSAGSASPERGVESAPASSSAGLAATATTAPTNTNGGTSAAGSSAGSSPHFVAQLSGLRLPTPTSRGVAFPAGASIVLAGGFTIAGTTGSVVQVPISGGPIATIGSLEHPVHDAAGVVLAGSMLVLGGGAATQDAWIQRVGSVGRSVAQGRLPAPRADLGAVIVGSEAIVVGGGAGGGDDPRVLATSDGAHFRLVASLPVAVRYAAVAAVGGTVFVIGGAASTGDVATIQAVDVAAGTARVVGQLPMTVSHAAALILGGSIVIAGGRRAGRALDAVLAIDPTTLAVRTVARLPQPMSDAAGVVVGGVGYLVGGEAAHPLATIVTITPS